MTKKRTKKVTKKSPDIVLLAAPTKPLPIHTGRFYRDHQQGFSGLWGCSPKSGLILPLVIFDVCFFSPEPFGICSHKKEISIIGKDDCDFLRKPYLHKPVKRITSISKYCLKFNQ